MKTVVGLFENFEQARSTLPEFARLGLSGQQVGLLSSAEVGGARSDAPDMSLLELPGLGRVAANGAMRQLLESRRAQTNGHGALAALTQLGVPKSDATRFVDGIKHGGILEALVVEDDKAADALAIMSRHTSRGASRTGVSESEVVIPVIKEELIVGKQEIQDGGVRVLTRVISRPVEKSVSLREERVEIERRVVNRSLDDLDEPFGERVIEMTANSEQPLIAKRARVVEEITIHKRRTERVEDVRDTLRETAVDVSEIPAQGGVSAHDFGRELAERMPAREWPKIEADARRMWEGKNPGSWERVREAIRAGWQSMTH